jgi:hypothetical protein
MGTKGTLCNRHIFEILRQAIVFQQFFNMGQIATGTLEPEDDLRAIPQGNHQLFFESLFYLLTFKGNPFAKKLGRCRDVKR